MKHILLGLIFLNTCLFPLDNNLENIKSQQLVKKYFGEELFQGNFKENRQFRYNANYILKVNDKVSVKIWGTHNYLDDNLTIDQQGNIFIPEIGAIHLLGLSASQLQQKVAKKVNNVFNADVHTYANVKEYQSISVFVSGAVSKIGLYTGLSTDSILQFIDKAGGILRGVGGYRNITVLRDKVAIAQFDLYDFLLNGEVDAFSFKNGDVILINPLKHFIEVVGDVSRVSIFELQHEDTSVQEIVPYVLPLSSANAFSLSTLHNGIAQTKDFKLLKATEIFLKNGDKLNFFSNYYIDDLTISISGEFKGATRLSLVKGATLYEVLRTMKFTPLSDIVNIQFYRKNIATIQKELLNVKLNKLEEQVLTIDSSSAEEATIRVEEAKMVISFISNARKVVPKGQLILNDSNDLRNILLEEGDSIIIPKKSNIIVVQGEVNIPNALSHEADREIEDYIKDCGGYTERADISNILLIKANGAVKIYDDGYLGKGEHSIEAGDSILVLRKVEGKNLILFKDLTQILYQIAIGAAVALQF